MAWNEEGSISEIFPGPLGKIVVATTKGVQLYDFTAKKSVAKLNPKSSNIKTVIWSKNFSRAAIVFKTRVIFVDKMFNTLFEHRLSEAVLSGYFNEQDSFIYSTHYHVKYIIDKESAGVLATLTQRIYLITITGSTLYYVDQKGDKGTMKLDMSEYNYKMNVIKGKIGEVTRQLSKGEVVGTLAIRYLEKQNIPDLALAYEKDDKNKFNLAIASGNLEAALLAAVEMKRKDYFKALAEEALRQGNLQVAEICYQKTMSFNKLVFLYLFTGNLSKLEIIMNLAKTKLKDPMLSYQAALLLGSVENRVKLLAESGNLPLAYVLARKHELNNLIIPLQEAIKKDSKIDQEILNVFVVVKNRMMRVYL